MGIRIQKYIGYFLPNNKIKNLLIKNYDEILENNDSINLDEVKNERTKRYDVQCRAKDAKK